MIGSASTWTMAIILLFLTGIGNLNHVFKNLLCYA